MGWRDALQYVRGAGGSSSSVQQDLGLPLGARLGGKVQLQKAPFTRAISKGSFIEMPVDSQNSIKAISRVNLAISGSVYRYYLTEGLASHNGSSRKVFVQVYVDQHGQVGDIIYCSQLTRITPESEDDRELFMGLAGAGLGDKTYCLWREQLAELGYGEADLHAAFGSAEAIDYWRDAGDIDQDFIQPFVGSETWLAGGSATNSFQQEIYYMPYRRELKETEVGNPEYLFITTEVGQSHNSAEREVQVDFMIGITVDPEQIAMQ